MVMDPREVNGPSKNSKSSVDTVTTTRCIWVTLEPAEVIELKRITMDSDIDSAVTFFRESLVPRVIAAASQRGVAQEMFIGEINNEHIPG